MNGPAKTWSCALAPNWNFTPVANTNVRFRDRLAGRLTATLATAAVALCLLVCALRPAAAEQPKTLRVLQDQYPRAFFFRSAEGFAANPRISYEQWEAQFERLMGIEGKVLEEEVPGRSIRNIDFFTRFKKRHPDQLVLLHYNGNARDPRDDGGRFFAGHWLYYNGAKILDDVPAENGETEIRVDHPELFHVNVGRYRDRNEDIGLCRLDERGRPDWNYAEQVQLVSVDLKRKVLRVRRGCYGTQPLPFEGGRAYAAAHVTEGPWGRKSHLLWFYNYSTRCPRDAQGRTCADVLADDVARRFAPGGQLTAFDGLEFDVLHHRVAPTRGGRGPDCDADGQPDSGFFDGVNTYGVGVIELCRQLRQKMGDKKLILADGMSVNNQRAFGLLNGIESEGWPTLSDWEAKDWSGGLNRHFFWRDNARPPVLNYINHKFVTHGPIPGIVRRPRVPFSAHRLVFAAAVFTDSAICYSYGPPKEPHELIGVWDELWKGQERQVGWLGRPLGPAVRLGEQAPDLLQGRGRRAEQLRQLCAGPGLRFDVDGDAVRVAPAKTGQAASTSASQARASQTVPSQRSPELRFLLKGVPTNGPDLLVSLTIRAERLRAYPPEMARLVWVGTAEPEGKLVRPDLPFVGMTLRHQPEQPLDQRTGAMLRYIPRRAVQGETHDAYLTHPPYRSAKGAVFWTRDVHVPPGGRLTFYTTLGERSPQRSDGVVFLVLVAELKDGQPGPFEKVFEHTQKAFRWVRHEVSLQRWAGKTVRLKFVADCGPNDNATTDHAHWGDVWVTGPNGPEEFTPPVRFMTWANQRPFRSYFYFSDVRTPQVDLEVRVEGIEPVWISNLTVHAHPDVVYRVFEHGLVLANPSPRPYRFDLAQLLPGQRFRRLRGTPLQDPQTNNGRPVGDQLTLPARDALFLVRVEP